MAPPKTVKQFLFEGSGISDEAAQWISIVLPIAYVLGFVLQCAALANKKVWMDNDGTCTQGFFKYYVGGNIESNMAFDHCGGQAPDFCERNVSKIAASAAMMVLSCILFPAAPIFTTIAMPIMGSVERATEERYSSYCDENWKFGTGFWLTLAAVLVYWIAGGIIVYIFVKEMKMRQPQSVPTPGAAAMAAHHPTAGADHDQPQLQPTTEKHGSDELEDEV